MIAVDVCCGSEHSLFLTEEGKLFSFGWNEHGSCGSGDEVDQLLPFLVEEPGGANDRYDGVSQRRGKWTKIGAGYGHSFALVLADFV